MADFSELMKTKINDKYTLMHGKQIGSGSFGVVYIGVDQETDECVAIKIEDAKSQHAQLMYEAKILKLMQGKNGIPKLYYYGEVAGFNVMAIDMLGPSLEDLFNMCGRKFSMKTVLMIADQLIARLETLHQKGFIHRDIKPENCLIGLGKKANIIHIIDYGLSKKYRDTRTNQHIPYKENKSLVGTARYASLNSHLGMEQSRRDDFEQIAQMFVYLLKGFLPWQGLKAADKNEKYSKIMEKKLLTPPDILCKKLPHEFSTFFSYIRSLKFEEKPDYLYMRKLFQNLFKSKGYQLDYMYDWCENPQDQDPDAPSLRVYKKASQGGSKPIKISIETAKPDQGDQHLVYDNIVEKNKNNESKDNQDMNQKYGENDSDMLHSQYGDKDQSQLQENQNQETPNPENNQNQNKEQDQDQEIIDLETPKPDSQKQLDDAQYQQEMSKKSFNEDNQNNQLQQPQQNQQNETSLFD